jgi:A/G-specific adenine glycosylase
VQKVLAVKTLSRSQLATLRRRLLAHYDSERRDLPWRRTTDPYRILVSEVMLQQTTVAAVIPYYESFLRRFPSLEALAAASEEDVLASWAGLGYYARARRLQQACREVLSRHGGRFPGRYDELMGLPGVGPYTAGAVASIAFRQPEPVLDGNVQRVLSRLLGRCGMGSAQRRQLLEVARRLVHGVRPGDLNQSLMELGATVCTPRQPRCNACPVARSCAGRRSGRPEDYPGTASRPAPEQRRGVALVVRDARGRVHLVRRPPGPLLPGLWELPGLSGFEADALDPHPSRVRARVAAQLGREVRLGAELARVHHTVLNRRVELRVREARFAPGTSRRPSRPDVQAVHPGRDPLPALSAACRKSLTAVGLLSSPIGSPRIDGDRMRHSPGGDGGGQP